MKRSQTKHELSVTTPTDREIVMKRTFDAPRQMVFDAYIKPELIKRWLLGPEGWSMPVCDVDFRVSGKFHYIWRNDSDGKEFGLHGVYNEIEAPMRIVHDENFDEPWYPGDAHVTTVFDERNDSTAVTMIILYDSREFRDAAMESGMEKGVAESYDRLAEMLEAR